MNDLNNRTNRTVQPKMKVMMFMEEKLEKLHEAHAMYNALKNGQILSPRYDRVDKKQAKGMLDNYIFYMINLLKPYLLNEKPKKVGKRIYDEYPLDEDHKGLKSLEKYQHETEIIKEKKSNGSYYKPSIQEKEVPKDIPDELATKGYDLIVEAYYELGFTKVGETKHSQGGY